MQLLQFPPNHLICRSNMASSQKFCLALSKVNIFPIYTDLTTNHHRHHCLSQGTPPLSSSILTPGQFLKKNFASQQRSSMGNGYYRRLYTDYQGRGRKPVLLSTPTLYFFFEFIKFCLLFHLTISVPILLFPFSTPIGADSILALDHALKFNTLRFHFHLARTS